MYLFISREGGDKIIRERKEVRRLEANFLTLHVRGKDIFSIESLQEKGKKGKGKRIGG